MVMPFMLLWLVVGLITKATIIFIFHGFGNLINLRGKEKACGCLIYLVLIAGLITERSLFVDGAAQ